MTIIDIKNRLKQISVERYLIILMLAFLLGGCLLNFSIKQLLFLVIGILILGVCFFSVRNALYLLVFVAIAIPTSSGLLYVTGIEIATKNIKIVEIIYVTILLSWGIQLALKKTKVPEFKKNIPFYLFFIYLIITACSDLLINRDPQNLFLGARYLFYYGIYFVAISTIKNLKEIKVLCNIIITGAIIYSMMIITMYVWPSNPLWQFTIWQGGIPRAAFRGVNAVLLGLALLFVRFFLSSKGQEKRYCILAIIPMLISLIIGLYRAGWIAFLMFIVTLFIILVRKHELNLIKTVKVCITSFFILTVLFMCLKTEFSSQGSTGIDLLVNRMKTFEHIETDSSITWRIKAMRNDIQKIMKNLVFGKGYSKYYYAQHHKEIVFFDNTHVPLLRMMGLVGHTLFIWMFLRFCKKVYYIFKYAKHEVSRVFSLTFISLMPGLIFLTFTCAYLVAWDFIAIFAILMAITEFLTNRVKNTCFSNNVTRI